MNDDKPESVWKKPLKPAVTRLLWLGLLFALFVIGLAIVALSTAKVELPYSYGWLLAHGFALLEVFLASVRPKIATFCTAVIIEAIIGSGHLHG